MGYFSSELLRYCSKTPTAKEVVLSGIDDVVGKINLYDEVQFKKVNQIANWLGIEALLPVSFGNLSFGQQKMVLIARAMIRNPEILLFDEPLQGMDIAWREVFKEKISEFSEDRTVLYVTHDKDEIPNGNWHFLRLENK